VVVLCLEGDQLVHFRSSIKWLSTYEGMPWVDKWQATMRRFFAMSSEHRLKPLNFRPELDERTDAKAALDERGWQMEPFLRACLRLLHAEPERMLAMLAPHRPPPRPMGRPRKPAE
jgi:hypothetical protein